MFGSNRLTTAPLPSFGGTLVVRSHWGRLVIEEPDIMDVCRARNDSMNPADNPGYVISFVSSTDDSEYPLVAVEFLDSAYDTLCLREFSDMSDASHTTNYVWHVPKGAVQPGGWPKKESDYNLFVAVPTCKLCAVVAGDAITVSVMYRKDGVDKRVTLAEARPSTDRILRGVRQGVVMISTSYRGLEAPD